MYVRFWGTTRSYRNSYFFGTKLTYANSWFKINSNLIISVIYSIMLWNAFKLTPPSHHNHVSTTHAPTHAPTHAQPGLPVNQKSDLTPPNLGVKRLHHTAAITFHIFEVVDDPWKWGYSDSKSSPQKLWYKSFATKKLWWVGNRSYTPFSA